MLANKLKAEVMLGDKLDAAIDGAEVMPTKDLLAISRDAADRTGHGKVQTNMNVNVDFASKLEAARRRSNAARIGAEPLAPSGEHGAMREVAKSVQLHASRPTQELSLAPSSFRRL
jgi:hypothetical protein